MVDMLDDVCNIVWLFVLIQMRINIRKNWRLSARHHPNSLYNGDINMSTKCQPVCDWSFIDYFFIVFRR